MVPHRAGFGLRALDTPIGSAARPGYLRHRLAGAVPFRPQGVSGPRRKGLQGLRAARPLGRCAAVPLPAHPRRSRGKVRGPHGPGVAGRGFADGRRGIPTLRRGPTWVPGRPRSAVAEFLETLERTFSQCERSSAACRRVREKRSGGWDRAMGNDTRGVCCTHQKSEPGKYARQPHPPLR